MANKVVKKQVKVNKVKVIALLLVLFIFILSIIILVNKKSNPVVGKWKTDKGTIYQFDKDYTGKLIVSTGEYKYKYEIDDNIITVDFENESSIDTKFKYKIEDSKLILENDNGVFTFEKID